MSSKKLLEAKLILSRAKKFLGISRDLELAERLGIAQPTLSMWKSRGGMDLQGIITLCEGVDMNWLLFGEGEMEGSGSSEQETTYIELDIGPGQYRKEVHPVWDDNGEIQHYIKAVYTYLTKEEGEDERKADGAG